ncbi:MAG: tripartite tricarboxylate transporter permease [Hydrogenophaga sp.]|uniref:tripartite tricarboxylate transporter permease n=1 Tax=Hydrogenophaga sp. TaxID=1904254 RepID=UPI002723145E|nr:tripartite tricarboxylate transporter permease [Hydrogenophaga sp.]MDO9134729.1 tripartite tricarboxylate transporter permease [Hydrogenophaga sp.]MDO9506753.1 tripartite tricarboxylate transporter permease [Hydrogenophaga sp.]MDP1781146.1 tripartite tricarboxylate transporter permease [Hydrogenophaga sp.]MDP2987724.1 tripartite tricarboxylate transporter permease [Hydrogenophaga sp.]MDP3203115.1 tripartite tricarboxylate transporter permease [Hydrogenophaga sp.]
MDLFANLWLGLQVAVEPTNLLYCFFGVFLGTVVGVLPGIGALAAISLLLPLTYHMSPTAAIIMLAGVYYGAQYGGSTASILLNLPGTPSSAVTCLDGYPMAKKGKAGVALFVTTIASLVGAMTGLIMLTLFSPVIAEVGLKFGPAEFCAMMLLGLVAASSMSAGSAVKGLCMMVFGLLLGMVGTDVNSGAARFSFDVPELMDGINLVALAMGLFGVAEVVRNINSADSQRKLENISLKSMVPSRQEFGATIKPMARGSALGAALGALPGVGPSIASFMSYAIEKRVAKDPSRFGKGAIEGIAAPEASNNAAAQTAFVPSLSLGIPGDAVMAVMLGALIIHGIQPGPMLITEQPSLFWGLVVSFAIGNLMLVILNLPTIGLWVALLRIPFAWMYPAILVFVALGVYSVNNNTFDIYTVATLGIMGYVLMVLKFEPAPLLLGYILGPLLEEYLRRALLISRGDPMTFLERPISATLLAFTALLLIWAFWSTVRSNLRAKEELDALRALPD